MAKIQQAVDEQQAKAKKSQARAKQATLQAQQAQEEVNDFVDLGSLSPESEDDSNDVPLTLKRPLVHFYYFW
ncbi:hypothetical protein JAAARDRAFT_200976 [Jaapia argillacea MUCL 33604]|uniref:Uncharacterized protein n=1 Tax=Jaapia argillacea MUCL 33604 TaxID=933084 RepID=A0A067P2Z8_9AGAM|nr:hypothetical protein JAAARDRAFT_200976 [Jaapia argillacea MUCL 33604]